MKHTVCSAVPGSAVIYFWWELRGRLSGTRSAPGRARPRHGVTTARGRRDAGWGLQVSVEMGPERGGGRVRLSPVARDCSWPPMKEFLVPGCVVSLFWGKGGLRGAESRVQAGFPKSAA